MPWKKGEENSQTKLTEKQVYAIRRDTRMVKLVAADYGISNAQAWRIRARKRWKYLEEENDDV